MIKYSHSKGKVMNMNIDKEMEKKFEDLFWYVLNDKTEHLNKEKEYMKTDIREYQNKYIMEIDLPGLKKEDIIIVIY